jgi:DNA processing protein
MALNADALIEEYGFKREVALGLVKSRSQALDKSASTAREMRRAGIRMVTVQDATYPSRLLNAMENPPPVLYAYGRLELLNRPLFAVANSNDASEEFLALGDKAAEAALQAAWYPVTGHNRIPYQRTALVARRSGSHICYVLDRGIFEAFGGDLSKELFPAARIWSPAYDPDRDLTLSCFPLWAHNVAVHNQRRDSIIFALASAIIAGDVRSGGQMEKLCRNALSRECPVYTLNSENDRLIGSGAVPATPQDIPTLLPRESSNWTQ